MFVPFNRTAITAAWFVVLGFVALLWSPPSVAMGAFVLLAGLACPALLLLLWNDSIPMAAPAVAPVPAPRPVP